MLLEYTGFFFFKNSGSYLLYLSPISITNVNSYCPHRNKADTTLVLSAKKARGKNPLGSNAGT